MNTSVFEAIQSFIEPCYYHFYCCLEYLTVYWRNVVDKEKERWIAFDYEINFDNAQLNAICFLSVFFLLNTSCVLFVWRFHGQQIFKKFKKPAPPRVFEELSRSLAHLKLPKSHSPRM